MLRHSGLAVHGWFDSIWSVSSAALLQLSRSLHGVKSIEDLMERVRGSVVANTRYTRAYVHLLHPDGKTFEIVGYVAPNMDMVKQRLKTIDASGDKLIQMAERAKEPFVIEDMRLHPLADQKQVAFFGNRTAICIPMYDAAANIGPLVIPTYADEGVKPPTADELEFLIQMGSLVAVVIGRLRAETAQREAEGRAAQVERMQSLGRMAGEVAHDFNNLLVSILTNVDLAVDELSTHPARELLDDVREAAVRASKLTRQLLAFSRGQVLNKRSVAIDVMVASLKRLLDPMMPKHVRLAVQVHSRLGEVQIDADQLERAVMNLVVNARDAIGDKQGTITIEAERVDVVDESIAAQGELAAGSYLVLSISDDGTGMDEQTRARIFEPFFTTKPLERGTGLGLSVVDGVVRQHGGSVHVYSEPGQGTTFKLYIPIGEVVEQEPPPPPRARTGAEMILVVDDDVHVRKTIERVLRRAGFAVLVASSGEGGLEAVRQEKIDLLLSDLVLPGIDGVEFGRQARALRPELRVRFMTGCAHGRIGALATPHLSKPFTAADLLRLIEHALDDGAANQP